MAELHWPQYRTRAQGQQGCEPCEPAPLFIRILTDHTHGDVATPPGFRSERSNQGPNVHLVTVQDCGERQVVLALDDEARQGLSELLARRAL